MNQKIATLSNTINIKIGKLLDLAKSKKEWLCTQAKPFLKPTLFIFLVLVVAFSALLRSNYTYVDDAVRVVTGKKGWDDFGRYMSNFFSNFVHGNNFLSDISPWPQLLAILIMSLSGVLVLYVLYNRKSFRWYELVAATVLALNPYFLECMSYKFDCIYMALSVLFMIVPLLCRHQKARVYTLSVFLCTLLTCTLYQASLGIFPMLVLTIAVREWCQKKPLKEILKFVLWSIIGYVLAVLVFKIFILTDGAGYVATSMGGNIITTVVGNFGKFYKRILSDFTRTWQAVICVVLTGVVIKITAQSRQNKVMTVVVSLALIVVLGLVCFGVYPALQSVFDVPRMMYGFGMLLAIICVLLAEKQRINNATLLRKIAQSTCVVIVVVLSYMFGTFTLIYGNALSMQKDYMDFRMELVADDLNELIGNNADATVVLRGSIAHAPAMNNMIKRYPVLGRLVQVQFRGDWYHGRYVFYNYYGLVKFQKNFSGNANELPIVINGWYHDIRQSRDGKIIVVDLKTV